MATAELVKDAAYYANINLGRARLGKGPHPDTPGLAATAGAEKAASPPAHTPTRPSGPSVLEVARAERAAAKAAKTAVVTPQPSKMACDEPMDRKRRIEALRVKVESELKDLPPEPQETDEAKRRKRKPHEGEAESFAERIKAVEKPTVKPPPTVSAPESMPDIVPARTNPEIASPGRVVLGDADSDMGKRIRDAGAALASGSPPHIYDTRCGDVRGSIAVPLASAPPPDPAWSKIRQTSDAIFALLDALDVYPPAVARLALDWVSNQMDASEA